MSKNIDNNAFEIFNKMEVEWKTVKQKKKYDKTSDKQQEKQQIQEKYFCQETKYPMDCKNKKKILCNNMLKSGICNYKDRCLYAHNYEEQNIDPKKKNLYEIISSDTKLTINLSKDEQLFHNLLLFTKICSDCEKHKCPGGYNCKYGIFEKKFQICYKDIYNGSCDSCGLIHLTKRGLIPFCTYNKNINVNVNVPEGKILNDECFNSDSDIELTDDEVHKYLSNVEEEIDLCEKSIFTITTMATNTTTTTTTTTTTIMNN